MSLSVPAEDWELWETKGFYSMVLQYFLLCVRCYLLELGLYSQTRQNQVLALREFLS